MSAPPQPIACLKCNTINFSGNECKQCGQELKVVTDKAETAVDTEEIQNAAAQEGVSEVIKEEAAAAAAAEKKAPAGAAAPPTKLAAQPLSGVDKEIARRKLRARLRDARSARTPLNTETEVLNKHGKRIVGARRVPVTTQAPLSTPDNPYERM